MAAIQDQMANHLEFLGYTIERIEPVKEGEKQIIIAKHSQKNNVVFFELVPGFTMFRVNLSSDKTYDLAMDTFVNNSNKILTISRLFSDIENGKVVLRFEAVYTSDYSKENFSQFMEIFSNDQGAIAKVENFSKLFLD